MLYFLIVIIACLSYFLGKQAQKNKNNEKHNTKNNVNNINDVIDKLRKGLF